MNSFRTIPQIFFSKSFSEQDAMAIIPNIRRAISLLFPNATPIECPDPRLHTPHSFFLREGSDILWMEVVLATFSKDQITDYLARAKQIEVLCHHSVSGILICTDYETGVRELLGLVRMPIRFFRIQKADSVTTLPSRETSSRYSEPAIGMEEVSSSPATSFSNKTLPRRNDFSKIEPHERVSSPHLIGAWNRLSREELREFIQLELDFAHKRA